MLLVLILLAIVIALGWIVSNLRNQNKELKHSKRSQAVRFGKYAEQFMAVLDSFPYNRNNFRFIGSPIDGIQFNKDKVVFIEFKTGNSRLSNKQKNIRKLVEGGKIEWETIRIPPN